MTFEELMKVTWIRQPVTVVLDDDRITGNADALLNYICEEVAQADVDEVRVENGTLIVKVSQ